MQVVSWLEQVEVPNNNIFGRVFTLLVTVGILSILLAGCSGQKGERTYQPQTRQSTSEDSAYEFVGGVFNNNELVAIVADKTVSEGSTNRTVSEGTNKTVSGGSRREVKAYVCDGEPQGDAEWFAGQTTSNMLDLTSVSGKARLQAQLTEKEVAGTITLTEGSSHRFSALAPRDGAGLYEVTIGPNGQRSGTSANGAKNEDTVSSDGVLTTGTIKLPSGEAIDYRMIAIAGYEGGFKPDTYTSIVLPGAAKERGRGGNVTKNTPSNNFISNELNL